MQSFCTGRGLVIRSFSFYKDEFSDFCWHHGASARIKVSLVSLLCLMQFPSCVNGNPLDNLLQPFLSGRVIRALNFMPRPFEDHGSWRSGHDHVEWRYFRGGVYLNVIRVYYRSNVLVPGSRVFADECSDACEQDAVKSFCLSVCLGVVRCRQCMPNHQMRANELKKFSCKLRSVIGNEVSRGTVCEDPTVKESSATVSAVIVRKGRARVNLENRSVITRTNLILVEF